MVSVSRLGDGMAYPGNRLRFPYNAANGHPAAFPVQLPSFFIKGWSADGDAWIDPFLGSGTTIIAAETLGRRCYGLELSPAYCDVIVQRWEKFTGKTAERIAHGGT